MPVAEKPQHLVALERANAIRLERAAIKREIKAGGVRVSDLLRDGPPACLDSLFVEGLLRTIRRTGRVTAQQMMLTVPIGLTVTVGKLTVRQRRALGDALDAREEPAS